MSTFGIIREVVYRGTCSSPSIFSLSFCYDPSLSLPLDSYAPFTIIVVATFPTGLTFKRSRIKILFALWKFTSFQQDVERIRGKVNLSQERIKSESCFKLSSKFLFFFLSSGFDSVIIVVRSSTSFLSLSTID